MCRNIRPLFNFDPPATDEEIMEASLQYVRKISGYNKPSQENTQAFELAVKEIAADTKKLLNTLTTHAEHKNREREAEKRKIRAAKRFA